MNIYVLLRMLVNGMANTGGISKEKAFDAMELITALEKANSFGTIASITSGQHHFTAKNGWLRDEFSQCAFCDKPYKECKGTK